MKAQQAAPSSSQPGTDTFLPGYFLQRMLPRFLFPRSCTGTDILEGRRGKQKLQALCWLLTPLHGTGITLVSSFGSKHMREVVLLPGRSNWLLSFWKGKETLGV